MLDTAAQLLLQPLAEAEGQCLWVADENGLDILPALAPHASKLLLISNRCDIVDAANRAGISSQLCDAQWPSHEKITDCFFRIAKEKPLVHHMINQARQHLPAAGRLWLSGYKQEGVKTYAAKTAELFGANSRIQKFGEVYLSQVSQPDHAAEHWLDTQEYPQLRATLELDGKSVFSKPGIYGWNKIDVGSRLLLDVVKSDLGSTPIDACLDLGCGYGYLTLGMAHHPIEQRTATDNNITAVTAMQANAEAWDLPVEAVISDCANSITRRFDLILCNPPFHKGFDLQQDLTQAFVQAASGHLQSGGRVYFVVNQFIPIEKKAAHHFKHCQLLTDNGQFKVVKCWQ